MEYNLQAGSHVAYDLQYFFLTVAKYEADILSEEIAEPNAKISKDTDKESKMDIRSMHCGSNLIQIPFTTEPSIDLTTWFKSLRAVISTRIRLECPVKQTFEDAFWQPGYFPATTMQVSIDVLTEYGEIK
jgi:putative transposase